MLYIIAIRVNGDEINYLYLFKANFYLAKLAKTEEIEFPSLSSRVRNLTAEL